MLQELAALAANEGLRHEAVAALRAAMARMPIVPQFDPRLPWFKSLEGEAGYADLLAERERRIGRARAEMQHMEAARGRRGASPE